ncbi:MAG: DUF3108 domain-containing protein [Thermoanaerobaculia bacterium]
MSSMTRLIRVAVLVLAVVFPAASAFAAAGPVTRPEELRYTWRLRGALSWIAGLKFPTSGSGLFRNNPVGNDRIESELRILGNERREGMYVYRSEIDDLQVRTLMTFHGYEWDGRRRGEQTRFDYEDGLARVRKEREERPAEDRVHKLPDSDMRDVLTGIYYLRLNADSISSPVKSEIYSDGEVYPVIFRPLGSRMATVGGESVSTRGFEIVAAPGNEKRWPGGVKVWLTADSQKVPVRIEIQRSLTSLQLQLDSLR